MAERFQPAGFCWSVFLCLVLAVLKLTVKAHWSWRRVSLPIWAVLGHNILYITIGLIWLYFADDGAAEEATTIRKGHGGHSYQIAALLCFVVTWSLGCSVCFANSCSGLRLWIPAIGEPTEGNDSQEFRLDSTGYYGHSTSFLTVRTS